MDIPIQGQYTLDDFQDAVTLHLATPRKLAILIVAVLLLLALLAVVRAGNLIMGLGTAIPFLFIAALFSYPLLLPRLQVRKIQGNPLLQHPISGHITDKAIRWQSTEGENLFPWETISEQRRSPQLILAYQTSGAFIPLPRHIFANDQDWERFGAFVQKNIPPKSDRRTQLLFGVVAALVALVAAINILSLFAP